jgi:hypothetical protein
MKRMGMHLKSDGSLSKSVPLYNKMGYLVF